MSLTRKSEQFIMQPMERKPVTAVPGVGPACARKLAALQITKAPSFYRIFLACNSNKVRFKSWTDSNCKLRPKDFDTCFDAFRKWQLKFPHVYQQNSDPGPETSRNIPIARGGPGRNVNFQDENTESREPSEEVEPPIEDAEPSTEDLDTSDPLVSFFLTIRQTVQKFPPLKQVQVKNQIYGIVSMMEAELIQRHEASEPVASTSNNGNGNNAPRSADPRFQQRASHQQTTNAQANLDDEVMNLD